MQAMSHADALAQLAFHCPTARVTDGQATHVMGVVLEVCQNGCCALPTAVDTEGREVCTFPPLKIVNGQPPTEEQMMSMFNYAETYVRPAAWN